MAQDQRDHSRAELGLYGMPSVIDMPTADMMPDGELATTIGHFAGMTRTTLSFQFSPRIIGSFRYSELRDWNTDSFDTYYDRSFDLRFQALTETARRPSVTIGLQDLIGTGIYSGEFIALSKTFGENDELSLTGGLGWGRLGSHGAIGSTGTRDDLDSETIDTGGQFNTGIWFRGDVAPFAGLAYRPTPNWTFKAEYSSDAYALEDDQRGIFDRDIPFNFGVEYRVNDSVRFGGYAMHGREVGVSLQFSLNPGRPSVVGTLDPAPPPVLQRPDPRTSPEFYTTDWAGSEQTTTQVRDQIAAGLRAERMEMEALELRPTSATLYLRNRGYRSPAQAYGRALRVMARLSPSSIEEFTIVLMAEGQLTPALSFTRTDVERLEIAPDGAEQMLARARLDLDPAMPAPEAYAPGVYPRWTWDLGPYARTSLFDPDNPFRMDLGVQLGARYQPAAGWLFAGTVQKKIVGNLDTSSRESNSELPRVRSDFAEYDKNGDPAMTRLYGAYYARPAPELYSRVTAGYLERMHAGISGELLWAPYDKRYALGAELNYSRQRDYEGGFGLQDYEVGTGHVSAYWRFDDDYYGQVDVGRYLAGDVGATFSLQRVFANGWRVGAFATLTDVSADEFGEGSFDKAITLEIPLDWLFARSNRVTERFAIRPVQRDGGARLDVPGRLFRVLQESQGYNREEQWGKFWR